MHHSLVDGMWAAWSSWSACVSCLIEENIDYYWNDVNDGRQDKQSDAESCQSFCKATHPSARYFTWVSPTSDCWCKTSNSGRRVAMNLISGELLGERSKSRVCRDPEPANGGMPCHPDLVTEEQIEEC